MSQEAILQAIHAAGEAQVSQIEEHTRAQVEAILAHARQEAEDIKAKAYRSAVAPAAKESSRLLHLAKLEALHITAGQRESLIDTALETAARRLSDLRTLPIYREVLSRLTQEALVEIRLSCAESSAACLQIDHRDRALINEILTRLQLDLPVQEDLSCWGGLVTCSQDGRVVIINTLEARLERATPFLRRGLSSFFEVKKCQTSTTETPAFTP